MKTEKKKGTNEKNGEEDRNERAKTQKKKGTNE